MWNGRTTERSIRPQNRGFDSIRAMPMQLYDFDLQFLSNVMQAGATPDLDRPGAGAMPSRNRWSRFSPA
jgi:hypothetical protein